MLEVPSDAFSNLPVDAAATSSLTAHLHFSIQEPALDPGAELVVVLDRDGVEEFGQGGLDLLVDLVKLVAILALVLIAHATVVDSWDGGDWVCTHRSTWCLREIVRLGGVVV